MSEFDHIKEFLERFHQRHPAATSSAFNQFVDAGADNSYEILARSLLVGAGDRPTVLDVGCGDGALLAEVFKLRPHAHMTGVDLSSADIALAKGRVPEARVFVGDFLSYPFGEVQFDCIAAHLVLMLVAPLEPFLLQVQRLLAPQGTFAFVTDVPGSEFADLVSTAVRASGEDSMTREFAHLVDRRIYQEEPLRALLGDHGLELQRFVRYQICGSLDAGAAWQTLLTTYPIGLLNDDAQAKAKAAIVQRLRSMHEIVMPLQLAIVKRLA